MGSMVLLDLLGGVALLLWGLHMVHSGILRAFGPDLRLRLGKALNNRFSAVAAGMGLTAVLQSSTATALITSSLAAELGTYRSGDVEPAKLPPASAAQPLPR
jgi:phosphate:Na+ symporter